MGAGVQLSDYVKVNWLMTQDASESITQTSLQHSAGYNTVHDADASSPTSYTMLEPSKRHEEASECWMNH